MEENGLADVSPVPGKPFSEQEEYEEEHDEGEPAGARETQVDEPSHAERQHHSEQREAPVEHLWTDITIMLDHWWDGWAICPDILNSLWVIQFVAIKAGREVESQVKNKRPII